MSTCKKLIWQDEFNGSALDPARWSHDQGYGQSGWGNDEYQKYTKGNVQVKGGQLVLTAKCTAPCKKRDGSITSARIHTLGKFSFRYGRVAARIKAPHGTGMWPAFWMLGANYETAGWPACGEIDIFEMAGPHNGTAHCSLHWDENGHAVQARKTTVPGKLHDRFRVYEVQWDAEKIVGKVDGKPYFEMKITGSGKSVFHQPFFILLNLAVGSDKKSGFVGPPDKTTVWPQEMVVDWVRVCGL